MHTAAALTIRPLPTRLAGVLEGRAAEARPRHGFPAAAVLLRRDDRPAGRFTGGTVADAAWPRGQMAPARSHVSGMAPVIMSPAGPRRPAESMASGLYCAWQDRPAAT